MASRDELEHATTPSALTVVNNQCIEVRTGCSFLVNTCQLLQYVDIPCNLSVIMVCWYLNIIVAYQDCHCLDNSFSMASSGKQELAFYYPNHSGGFLGFGRTPL
jgi:hypothetical protein